MVGRQYKEYVPILFEVMQVNLNHTNTWYLHGDTWTRGRDKNSMYTWCFQLLLFSALLLKRYVDYCIRGCFQLALPRRPKQLFTFNRPSETSWDVPNEFENRQAKCLTKRWVNEALYLVSNDGVISPRLIPETAQSMVGWYLPMITMDKY